MDEASVAWWFLVGILIWQAICDSERGYDLLKRTCGCFTRFISWYVLMFAGLGFLFLRTWLDVVKFEYVKLRFLNEEGLWRNTTGLTHEDLVDVHHNCHFTNGTRFISLASPIPGAIALFIVIYHVYSFTSERSEYMKYLECRRLRNMIIMTLAMPAFYAAMSLRATIRIWSVMTGSAWPNAEHICGTGDECNWEQVKALELATYNTDLGVASTFQFFAVFMFGQICRGYLKKSPFLRTNVRGSADEAEHERYKTRLSVAALQGIYFYVLIGIARSACQVLAAVGSEMPEYRGKAAAFQAAALEKTNTVNMFVTIAGVFNMFLIGNLKDVSNHLGNTNMKFNGTRALLLVSQIQLQVLQALTSGSALQLKIQHSTISHYGIVKAALKVFKWTTYQADLMHVSLLSFECLMVVLLNWSQWKKGAIETMMKKTMTDSLENNSPSPEAGAPLLHS